MNAFGSGYLEGNRSLKLEVRERKWVSSSTLRSSFVRCKRAPHLRPY
jgi:hypothetical protein